MKTKSIILSWVCLLTLSVILSSFIDKKTPHSSKTEEYEIVDVMDNGEKKFIRVTKDDEASTEIEWKREKTDDRDDYRPILKVLNQLNEQGYEMLNGSLAYESSAQGNGGNPRQTYFMVRKIK